MRVTSLAINNLRNLAQVDLKPGASINVLHGANGAGKTTVIESLLILAKGSSFRGGNTSSLIGPGSDHYLVRAELLDDAGKAHSVALQRRRSEWEGRLDGKPLQQISDTAHLFPLILMEPNTHQMVGGPPEGRRRYLDWTVFHVKHDFLALWRRYVRALKQRNAALRERDVRVVRSLDPQLIKVGNQLAETRAQVFVTLLPLIVEKLALMSPGQDPLDVTLQPGWSADSLAEALQEGLERDMEHGYTREGPHRADLALKVGGKPVRDRLSRGEQKILAGAMCLAQGAVFKEAGHTPILLLDDLASEFDEAHLKAVVNNGVSLGSQIFITGTSELPYINIQPDATTMFHVKQGEITPVT